MSKRAKEAAFKAYQHGADECHMCVGVETLQYMERRFGYIEGYEQAEKNTIKRIREQVKQWMPEKNGEEHTCGERVAFNSVLHLLEEMEKE